MAASPVSWRRCLRSPLGRLQYCGFASELSEPAPSGREGENGGVRLAEDRDVPRLVTVMNAQNYEGHQMDAATVMRRFEAGDVCALAEVDGELAALSWIRFDNASFRKSWVSIPLKQGEAYFAWTHTEPAHRGKGLATRLALWRLRWLREQGVRVAYSWIRPTNAAMLSVTVRAGAVAISHLTQYYPRVLHRPRLNVVRVAPTLPRLREWCSPARMRFPQGLTLFDHAAVGALQPAVKRDRHVLPRARSS
jgi:GNAT superfamily N-acetyltransferase